MYVQLRATAAGSNIVIQRNEIRYLTPITCDFEARARLSSDENWCDFLRMLARRKKSRVNVSVDLTCKGALVGEFAGSFVAMADQPFNPVALVGLTTCQGEGAGGADPGEDRS